MNWQIVWNVGKISYIFIWFNNYMANEAQVTYQIASNNVILFTEILIVYFFIYSCLVHLPALFQVTCIICLIIPNILMGSYVNLTISRLPSLHRRIILYIFLSIKGCLVKNTHCFMAMVLC